MPARGQHVGECVELWHYLVPYAPIPKGLGCGIAEEYVNIVICPIEMPWLPKIWNPAGARYQQLLQLVE